MKFILLILLTMLILVNTSTAQEPYCIYVIVYDQDGNLEPDIPVTFVYQNESMELITVEDGSVVLSTLNFDNVQEGEPISIKTKYGIKIVFVHYDYIGSGVVFNDPGTGVAALIAMGFTVISAGAGTYYLLRRKTKNGNA